MKKILYTLLCLVGMMAFTSCSETDDETNEYENWKQRNDEYFNGIYTKAEASIKNESNDWKIFNCWSMVDNAVKDETKKIVVEVLQNGSGPGCPMYTDSVRVHYEGRMMPTAEHPKGVVFDASWSGDYNPNTMVPAKFLAGGLVDGFTTALLHMHVGDRWRVYMPYDMAYGSSEQKTIPAYSTLIFDITLQAYSRPGYPMPTFR